MARGAGSRSRKAGGGAFGLIGLVVLAVALLAVPGIEIVRPRPWENAIGWARCLSFGFALLAMLILFAAFGRAVTGYLSGLLLSGRNTYSLSRLQMVGWTWIVLSALFAAAACNAWGVGGCTNVAGALDITIPDNLLVVLGIAGFTGAAGPAALALRGQTDATPDQLDAAKNRLGSDEVRAAGQVLVRSHSEHARLLDVIQGDEVANAGTIDISKVQQLLITGLLLAVYAALVFRSFWVGDFHNPPNTPPPACGTSIFALPDFSSGFAYLVGISHAAYLTYKAVPKPASSSGAADAAAAAAALRATAPQPPPATPQPLAPPDPRKGI